MSDFPNPNNLLIGNLKVSDWGPQTDDHVRVTMEVDEYEDLPSTLWHYTDRSGFDGIRSSQVLWAGETQYLNDRHEEIESKQVLDAVLDERIKATTDTFELAMLEHFIKYMADPHNENRYVVSFSECEDDLSQWRAYGGASGYCLGFSLEAIYQVAKDHGMGIARCIYDEEEKKHLLEGTVDRMMQYFKDSGKLVVAGGAGEATAFDDLPEFVSAFWFEYRFLTLIFKPWAFRHEREWRMFPLAFEGSPEVKFRPGRGSFLPYREIGFGTQASPLTSVIVGPHDTEGLDLRAVRRMMESDGLIVEDVEANVRSSTVPYRTW